MKRLPFILVYSRFVMAILIGIITWINMESAPVMIVGLMTTGLLTDIFDGIIARRLGVATEKLRVWDSNVDQFFWIVILFSVFILHASFFMENYLVIMAIVVLEAVAYMISFLKFDRPIATHSYMAKIWTLTLFAFLVDLTLHAKSNLLFWICAIMGIVSRVEIILIIALLKKWATDVPSVLSVRGINKKNY